MSSKRVPHKLTRVYIVAVLDTAITTVTVFTIFVQSLKLLMIDFEIFLAAYPILVVLRHLEWVLDWWEWLNRHLIYQVAPLKVLFQIQSQHRNWLAALVLRAWFLKLSSNDVIDF